MIPEQSYSGDVIVVPLSEFRALQDEVIRLRRENAELQDCSSRWFCTILARNKPPFQEKTLHDRTGGKPIAEAERVK